MRALLLALALIPFLVWAGRDAAYHLRDRKPGILENVTHVLLGGSQLWVVVAAFRADISRIALAAMVVAVFGSLDEFVFHRGLSARESDLHAKSHLALFGFVALAMALVTYPDLAAVLSVFHGGRAP